MSILPASAKATTRGGLMRKFALMLCWIRASKFRFPERTAQTTSSPSATAREISSGSGPEFPMHVVHP